MFLMQEMETCSLEVAKHSFKHKFGGGSKDLQPSLREIQLSKGESGSW